MFDGDPAEIVFVWIERGEIGVIREYVGFVFAMAEGQYQSWNVIGLEFSDPCEQACLDCRPALVAQRIDDVATRRGLDEASHPSAAGQKQRLEVVETLL